MAESKFDSLLFDMDGTLWDAVDSYCAVWNRTIDDFKLPVDYITYPRLASYMGKPLETIYSELIGTRADHDAFLGRLIQNERAMMPELGGKLYPDVKETLTRLGADHKLFMVSNCDKNGLPNFLRYTGMESLFTDVRSFGQTGKEKDANITDLVERYSLKSPLYIGDVQHDCDDAHKAGVPFAWASYGFGKDVRGEEYKLQTIKDLFTVCYD